MNIWKRLLSFSSGSVEQKESRGRSALVMNQVGRPIGTPKNYEGFAREGYQQNVIVFRCVSMRAKACAGIPWELFKGKGKNRVKIEEHPILKLLERPNPVQSGAVFTENLISFYALTGNSYVEMVRAGKAPFELWPLRPDKMKVVPGKTGVPQAYVFGMNGNEVVFPVDMIKNKSDILQLKTFNPLNDWYGMSPIEAAMYSVDQHNEASKWNLSLLENMGTPSGAFVVKQDTSNPMGTLPEPQYNNLKDSIRNAVAGSQNAGRILLLEGGLDWKQMSLSPQEMSWLEGKNMSSRDIALAFGVPPIRLNIPGDSTFNNVESAKAAFYEETVFEDMNFVRDEYNRWLTPEFSDNLYLDYDKDGVPALEVKRAAKFTQVNGANFLTINEKREQTGYSAIEGGDVLLLPSGQQTLGELVNPEPETVPDAATQPGDTGAGNESDDETETENEAETPEEELADDEKEFHSFEVKQINIQTAKGKRRAWAQVNAARKKLTAAMYLDVKEELLNQSEKVANSIKGVDQGLWEYAALAAIDKSETQIKSVVEKHLKRGLNTFALPILDSGKSLPEFETKIISKFQQFVNQFVEANTGRQVTEIQNTSKKKARAAIKKAIQEGLEAGDSERDISKSIKSELDSISDARARVIARTEIGMASSNGALNAAKSLEIPDLEKEWVSDNRPFADLRDDPSKSDHQVMDGVRVGLDEKFTVPPDADMDGPHDPSAGPEQIINCQCALIFSRGGKSFLPTAE